MKQIKSFYFRVRPILKNPAHIRYMLIQSILHYDFLFKFCQKYHIQPWMYID